MNPLLSPYSTPFEIPPFRQISTDHFRPALEYGMKIQNDLVEKIINEAEPTFEKTIVALEHSGSVLQKVKNVFFNFTLALSDEKLQDVAKEMAPALSRHWDAIKLNDELFDKVRQIWEQRDLLQLDQEEHMLLKNTYNLFFKNGAALGEAEKKELMQINESLSQLSLSFGRNILAENNSYQMVIHDEDDLAGLSESLINQAKEAAIGEGLEGKWLFTLQWSSVMPFLQYAENRALRKQLWEAYQTRGNNNNEYDNKALIKKIVNLRREKAKLLGYENHAAFMLEDSMAGTPGEVHRLLDKLWTPAIARAKAERDTIQEYIDTQGLGYELAPWDWRYIADQLRTKQGLDMQELMPYFSLETVIEGVFMVTNRLYGLEFMPLEDVPLYHPDAVAYDVKEKDGTHIGILLMDFYARKSKQGGAWMTKFRSQYKNEASGRIAPIISIVCNFSKPPAGQPCLLDLDEVSTLFHEFGHALHGLLSNVRFQSLAGTAVPRDFVELPSQIMENWAMEPGIMKQYARHHQTGESISDELLQKIKDNGKFDQGFANTEYLAAALLDLAYHQLEEDLVDVDKFEKDYLNRLGLIDEIIPRYRSTYFNHIFSGGYSASYYSYIWAAVLDSDAYEIFKTKGLFDKETAGLFRRHVLEKGGSEEPLSMFKNFKGSGPEIDALLKKRGLDAVAESINKLP